MSALDTTTNTFGNLANTGTQKAAINAADTVSTLARNGNSVNTVLQKNGPLQQNERLYSARSRYASVSSQPSGGSNVLEARGQWAFMKLLTSQKQLSEYINGSTPRQLSPGSQSLLGQGGVVAGMADTSGTNNPPGYDKFLLTDVSCTLNEKTQISEVFGDNEVVYYFGKSPMLFNIGGLLIDSIDNDWFVTWLKLYSDFLRGTQTAQNYELIKLVLPNMVLTGTIMNFSWHQTSTRDVDIPFSFQFVAKKIEPLPAVKDGMVMTNRLAYVDFAKAGNFVSTKQINSLKNQLSNLSSVIQDPTSSLRDKANALSGIGSNLGGSFGSSTSANKGFLSGFQATIDGWNSSSKNFFNSIQSSALFQSVTSSLNGIRTNLFSPIYGVISSLMKLVSNTYNSAVKTVLGFITPVRNLLRDITNLSQQAISLVNLVNNSITNFGRVIVGQVRGLNTDFNNAIKSLSKAAGTVATAPITAAHAVSQMFSEGYLTTSAPFLKVTPTLSFTKPRLNLIPNAPTSKIPLITGVSQYTTTLANTL